MTNETTKKNILNISNISFITNIIGNDSYEKQKLQLNEAILNN
ncbi:hypothetical protein [Romboutsia sp.]|nr:hypothetical protein [Romboutsia sp.]